MFNNEIFHTMLNEKRIGNRGLFKPAAVKQLWQAGKNAGFLPLKKLFSIVMLELWFERFYPDASWQ